MADYRTHITVSGCLGVGYGAGAALACGFNGVQGALAGLLTGIAGMLPDLDSQSGRPVREIFGVTAALAPMAMMPRLYHWGGTSEGALLLAVLLYLVVKYGAGLLLGMTSVHRGMFHSLPALLIAAEVTFLGFPSEDLAVRALMALGVASGFASHLVLDEIYSVEWSGLQIKLKSSAGSAIKFLGTDWTANILTYGLLFTLTYASLLDGHRLQKQRHHLPAVEQNPYPQARQPVLDVFSR